jgi:hypothetical protein
MIARAFNLNDLLAKRSGVLTGFTVTLFAHSFIDQKKGLFVDVFPKQINKEQINKPYHLALFPSNFFLGSSNPQQINPSTNQQHYFLIED